MPVDHYENFPVASVLLPAAVRRDVVHLYRFARAADDIADEGAATPAERLQSLSQFRQAIHAIGENSALDNSALEPIFVPLASTIRKHQLPLTPFIDLLSAFEQDVTVKQYQTEQSLNDYCRRSANPVGRLMLALFKQTDSQSLLQSDAICSALQRINFLQDVAIDWAKQRVYLPKEAMLSAKVSIEHLEQGRCDSAWQILMGSQVQICRDLMQQGAPLGRRLPGRFGLEVRLIMMGGLRILEKIKAVDYDVFHRRPTLTRSDWPRLIWRAL
jgi:squalene synthase HpnC